MDPAPTLLVITGPFDGQARDFVARQAPSGATLLLPRDLSRPGWQFPLGDPAAAVAVAGQRRFALRAVGTILVRLPAVSEADLPHIVAEDRAYVAAELSAFLLALLALTEVPVLNRPTTQCLCGPWWDDARWRRLAGHLGLPVRPAWRHATYGTTPADDDAAAAVVSIVGDACIGAPNATVADAARGVATAAGAAMLSLDFDGTGPSAALLRARPLVDLDDLRVEAAVLRLCGVRAPQAAS